MLTLSNVTPAHERTELTHWENRPFIGAWPQHQPHHPLPHQLQPQHSMLSGVTKTLRKKKRVRTCFTDKQLLILEEIFSKTKYVKGDQRKELSESLRLEEKSIKIWFQNRRMKEKRANSESDSNSESSGETNTSESSPSPDSYYRDERSYEIILRQQEAPVTENEVNTEESSHCQSPLDLSLDDQNHASESITHHGSYVYNNLYPTEYYPSYGSGYYSTISLHYQNSEYANNIGSGTWYADANNYFHCYN